MAIQENPLDVIQPFGIQRCPRPGGAFLDPFGQVLDRSPINPKGLGKVHPIFSLVEPLGYELQRIQKVSRGVHDPGGLNVAELLGRMANQAGDQILRLSIAADPFGLHEGPDIPIPALGPLSQFVPLEHMGHMVREKGLGKWDRLAISHLDHKPFPAGIPETAQDIGIGIQKVTVLDGQLIDGLSFRAGQSRYDIVPHIPMFGHDRHDGFRGSLGPSGLSQDGGRGSGGNPLLAR